MRTKIYRLVAITTSTLAIAIVGSVNSVPTIAVDLKPVQKLADTTQLNQANQYTFTDPIKTTEIVFFPQAPGPVRVDDPPKASQLIYHGPSGELTFRGKEIRKQKSALGLLITVTLEPNFDRGQLELTLVLPTVNLENGQKQNFDTVAIKARGLGRVINRAGSELTYLVLPLKGVAEQVPLPL
ncbi:hypothetical protein CDG77_29435 [Nostoc sp. 'Peltigera membranacea cyanobiont' 213]|uniref:hypothetical protein n=1 Tax=unclassified Nostoc TaxID=2593658 RepID=UPI000B952A8B|nr:MULTISPECIES: hypothetical protein [unclassified Nostoc]AVH62137.1 hypothetical protein NPM_0252 [Nostoc sp. 'Peltigera membranacea cyanobiont' N6]OYD87426.1 hypothetical protein CDG77_29435 [Nostoc sp. 'Peltigera membranacea cyanobiont' 213]